MQVAERHDVTRFRECSVPRWFGVDIKPSRFGETEFMNSVMALFHLNSVGCQIMPATQVINHQRCKMDIDRSLVFLKVTCASV